MMSNEEVEIRLACNARELESAYRLLHDKYVEQGYQAPDPSGMRLLPHYALPTTHTFIVARLGEIIGTATLVQRGALGLPMEAQHAEEIAALCTQGFRPAEISGLAFQETDRMAVLALMRTLLAFAKHSLNATDLCIAVNPAHVRFYTKCLLFEDLGRVRPCQEVNGALAVPLRLNLDTAFERCAQAHVSDVIGRHFSPEMTDYKALAHGVRRDVFSATLARLAYARRWMGGAASKNSPTRRWKVSQARVVRKECKKETRRIKKSELARAMEALRS